MTDENLKIIKQRIRISNDYYDESIKALVEAAENDLQSCGIEIDYDNKLVLQAVSLYVLAFFNSDEVSETFLQAYEKLKTQLHIQLGA